MSDSRINVVLAGGRKLFREGLSLLLERHDGVHVIGEAEDAAGAPGLLRALPVHVVILSLSPALHGVPDLVRSMLNARPGVKVLILTLSPGVEYVQDLLEAGIAGCLTKECAGTELVAAVRRVAEDGIYLSPALVERVVTRYVHPSGRTCAERPLAPRERQILRLVAAGKTTKEIAWSLRVSTKTVETHRRRIMEKLNRHSVAELTKYAVMEGLTTLETSA